MKRAKAAGFDAVGAAPFPGAAALCEKHGLEFICYIDGGADYEKKLVLAAETKPARVNVQAFNHDTLPKETVKRWIRIVARAEQLGLNVDLEVHRDTCTETPEKTYEIADHYEKMTGRKLRFLLRFLHIAVVKHLLPPFAKRLLVRPDLVQLSRQVHLRPFNGHHAQVPATDGRGRETPEFLNYLEFVDAFLACWFAGARGGEGALRLPGVRPDRPARLRALGFPERVEGRDPAAREDRRALEEEPAEVEEAGCDVRLHDAPRR